MEILEIAIKAEGGVGRLASALHVRQNVVSNWRTRNRLSSAWQQVLTLKYATPEKKKRATKADQQIPKV